MVNRRGTDPIIISMNREVGEIKQLVAAIHERNGGMNKIIERHDEDIEVLQDNQNKIKWFAGGIAATISGAAWVMGLFK